MRFTVHAGRFSVVRLPAGSAPSPIAGSFVSVTSTPGEVSVVCPEAAVPPGGREEGGWRLLELAGPIPFDEVGVAARFTGALAAAGVGVFVLSTFDTDWVLVKESRLEEAIAALEAAGYEVG